MKNIIIPIVYSFFSKIILLEIILRSRLFPKTKLFYSGYGASFGFGDHVVFCFNIKKKICDRGKIFCFSKLQFETALFFYDKKYIIKSFLALPKFLNESGIGFKYLYNNKNFKPTKLISPHNKNISAYLLYYGTEDQIKFIQNRIKDSNISANLKNILKKKTITLFIKNFSLKGAINKNINYQVRQTRNLDKIYKLIKFITKQNFNIIILGTNKDHFIKIIKNKKIINEKNIFLFKDLSENYSIADQAYLANYSSGYIGNGSGSCIFFDIMKKKLMLIDFVNMKKINLWKHNRILIFKKVYDKNSKQIKVFDWYKKYESNNYKIIESNYLEIKSNFMKNFK